MDFRQVFRWLILFIPCYSLIAIISLLFEVYDPMISFFIAVIASISVYHIFKDVWLKFINFDKSLVVPIIGIILLALVFRHPPYKMIHGGQDQGLYVNMSAHFQRGDETCFNDEFRNSIKDLELQKIYDKNRFPTKYQPGTYDAECENEIVFQFYHLFPLWMSGFGELFGDASRYYALTFFALISLLGLTLLLFELTGSKPISILFGLFLALNPLHAFFSKWPVTEIPALAFTSIGLWLFVRTWNSLKSITQKEIVIFTFFSSVFFSLYFFTRISGFIFAPFIFFLLSLGIWKQIFNKPLQALCLFIFSGTAIVLYLISIFYGLEFSPNYSNRIYEITFSKLSGFYLPLILILTSTIVIFYLISIKKNLEIQVKLEKQITNGINILFPILFCLIILLGAEKIFSNEALYNGHNWRYALMKFTFPSLLIYSGVILIPISAIIYFRNYKYKFNSVFLIFLFAPIVYKLYLNPSIPYQFYYSRYLVSELLPYSLLFVFYLFKFIKMKWAVIFTCIGLIIPSYLSIQQVGVEEGQKAMKF